MLCSQEVRSVGSRQLGHRERVGRGGPWTGSLEALALIYM